MIVATMVDLVKSCQKIVKKSLMMALKRAVTADSLAPKEALATQRAEGTPGDALPQVPSSPAIVMLGARRLAPLQAGAERWRDTPR